MEMICRIGSNVAECWPHVCPLLAKSLTKFDKCETFDKFTRPREKKTIFNLTNLDIKCLNIWLETANI